MSKLHLNEMRTVLSQNAPHLIEAFERLVLNSTLYDQIRSRDLVELIVREAPDGTISILKGEQLDLALMGLIEKI